MTDNETSGTRRIESVIQAFNIIEYLRESGSATLTEIANVFDMPMSTAHIHLSTLLDTGYIVKKEGEYHHGLRFLRAGGQLRDRMALYQVAKPEVNDLRTKSGEQSSLGVNENGHMVQLYKAENPASIDDNVPAGTYLPLHATGTGKAILSQLSETDRDRIFEQRGLSALTDETITNRETLEEELREIQDRGYAINREEHFTGVCAVAVPILSKESDVIGAISISGPLSRIDSQRIEETLAPELFNKKNIIELKIKQYGRE